MDRQVSRTEQFTEVYIRHLEKAVREHPEEYRFPIESVPNVAAKMVPAPASGSANKDGRAVKGACKELGIKYTLAGIRAFFTEEPTK